MGVTMLIVLKIVFKNYIKYRAWSQVADASSFVHATVSSVNLGKLCSDQNNMFSLMGFLKHWWPWATGWLTLQPSLFPTQTSNICLLFNPFSELGDACVDTRLVPTSAALSPAHNARLEPLPALFEAREGASRVTLVIMVGGEWLLDCIWMRSAHINKLFFSPCL